MEGGGCRGRRDTWIGGIGRRRRGVGSLVEEDGGGLVGDGEGFKGGKGNEGGAGEAERAAVVGVSRCQVVASVNGVLH